MRSGSFSNSNGSPSTTVMSASFPGLERPQLVPNAQEVGGAGGRGDERLFGREPVLRHELKLAKVRAVRRNRTVRTHRHFHAGIRREPEGIELRTPKSAELLADGLGNLGILGERLRGVTRRKGRHEPGPSLDHQLRGLGIEERSVLDGAHARSYRSLDSLGSVRVRHHPSSEVCGGRDDRFDLLLREMRQLGVVGRREEPTRRRDLDDVGARANHLAYLGGDAVDAVAHGIRHAGIRDAPR